MLSVHVCLCVSSNTMTDPLNQTPIKPRFPSSLLERINQKKIPSLLSSQPQYFQISPNLVSIKKFTKNPWMLLFFSKIVYLSGSQLPHHPEDVLDLFCYITKLPYFGPDGTTPGTELAFIILLLNDKMMRSPKHLVKYMNYDIFQEICYDSSPYR